MNPEIKSLWINALESGAYKRGTGTLRTYGGNFCCLGVLCDLYAKMHSIDFADILDRDHYGYIGLLPEAVCHWAGISDNDVFIYHLGTSLSPSLADLNDDGPDNDSSYNCVIPEIKKL